MAFGLIIQHRFQVPLGGGRNGSEYLPESIGISGRNASEYADAYFGLFLT